MTRAEEQLVSEGPTPILVYDRIDANRRKTRLLLASFAVALLPIVVGGAAVVFPFINLMYVSVRPAHIAALSAQMRTVQPAADGTYALLDLTPLLWLYGGVLLVSMAIVALVLVATTDRLISSYGSRVVLRLAHARPVDSDEESDLVQLVEKLCIGAGLPLPRIHLIESAAPNAFATGRNPSDASLVVTRGLLGLLDRRELEGVIAHELSHIGNHDIALSTMLAALIGTVSLPLKLLSSPLRVKFRIRGAPGGVVVVLVLFVLFGQDSVLMVWWTISGAIGSMQFYLPSTSFDWWWPAYALIVPWYAVFGAPLVGVLIRQAVSRQREFLADADAALLTRDPEGVALALVKIGAVGGERLRVGEGTVHLYFVDPLSKGSWLHAVFPSHPPLEKRVELLARMGNGIAPSAIQAATDAGASFQHTKSGVDEVHAPLPDPLSDEPASSTQATEPTGPSDDGFTRVYDRPDDGSRVVALLPEHAVVKVEQREGDFVRVATGSGVGGWVFRSAPLDIQAVAAADHALTPLYEQPDGWSRVLALLPESAVVIPIATEGHFIRVTTAEHQSGYVSRTAPLTALKNLQRSFPCDVKSR
jgi:heat shock protein HtpX